MKKSNEIEKDRIKANNFQSSNPSNNNYMLHNNKAEIQKVTDSLENFNIIKYNQSQNPSNNHSF